MVQASRLRSGTLQARRLHYKWRRPNGPTVPVPSAGSRDCTDPGGWNTPEPSVAKDSEEPLVHPSKCKLRFLNRSVRTTGLFVAFGARMIAPLRMPPSRPTNQPPARPSQSRRAFTLVETLVATGMVLIMMTLFGTIFQMATQAMTVQKGLSVNDQKARLVVMMLRNDLNGDKYDKVDPTKPKPYRTFRNLIPFGAGENGQPHFNDADRCGYFYVSENDPLNDGDDVLQLTITTPDTASDRFQGRVACLLPDTTGQCGKGQGLGLGLGHSDGQGLGLIGGLLSSLGAAPGQYWPDQPEFDDVQGTPNGAGSSTMAEVSYFLRQGNLYRRLMLIRKPNVENPPDDSAPLDLVGNSLSLAAYGDGGTNNFFADLDYSAIYTASGARFHGGSSLKWCASVYSLQNPAYRFGFDNTSDPGKGYGQPREFAGTAFIGRFTHGETSHPNFGYPGRCNAGCQDPNSSWTNLSCSNGIVTNFANGPREGEDLLVSNVHSFDIKMWDPAASPGPDGKPGKANFDDDGINGIDDIGELGSANSDDGAFRDLGHTGAQGFYKYLPAASRPNNYYANSDLKINRFDTWHPCIDLDGDGQDDDPPFRPICAGADLRPGKANCDDDGLNGIDDAGELGWPGSDDFAPLTAIQITVRFYDEISNQVKEVTTVISLAYTP